jgi:predicted DNA-binding transcriptional regulator YafY
MPSDYSRLHRLLAIIQMISGKRGVTGRDLTREFHVDARTVRRDIQALNRTGIPCYHDRETGGYTIRRGFFMPPVEFTFEEALSLLTLVEQIPTNGQIPYLATAHRALQKIRSQLRDDIKDYIEPLDGRIQIDLARGSGDDGAADVYEKVRHAIARRRVLRCRYQANQSAQTGSAEEVFELRPYALWYCQRAFYVVGWHAGRQAIRQLKLNRFDYMERTDKPYAIPDSFSLKNFLGNAWRMVGGKEYRVVIRFEKEHAVTAAETRWHPTQDECWNEDGSVTLSFTVAGLEEVKWFVLGYGPFARAIQPDKLANDVRKLAAATAQRYEAGPRRAAMRPRSLKRGATPSAVRKPEPGYASMWPRGLGNTNTTR